MKKNKDIYSKISSRTGKAFASVMLFASLFGMFSAGVYDFGGEINIGSSAVGIIFAGALRMVAPAVCIEQDDRLYRELKGKLFEGAVNTSMWFISPAAGIKEEDNYTLCIDPMYADYEAVKEGLILENGIASENLGINASEEEEIVEESMSVSYDDVDSAVPEETEASAAGTYASGLPEPTGNDYSLDELKDFDFLKNSFYFVHSSTTVTPEQLNAEALLSADVTIEKNSSVPQILIYHTHAYEAFADSVEGGEDMTIVGAGNYLVDLLTNVYGYNVIHDTTLYHYNDAYSEACDHISEVLAANPTVELIIDLHRDAANEGTHLATQINGKPTAKIMFFNGMCQTVDGPLDYVSNPYLENNLALSLKMKLLAEKYYPGFTRKNFLKAYRYNQHLCEHSMLIEAGANTNTYAEVKNAMEPLAALLDAVLSGAD